MKLKTISTLPPVNVDKDDILKATKEITKEIAELQVRLFASAEKSILIILQGMDASGKSSTIRDVFKYVNPMGVKVKSFKKPTNEEFSHDFLWRVHKNCPAKGMIQIFDRSHYEDILIQRVHKWIDEERVQQRIKHINNFEQLLVEESNTTILKFYLHVSKEEQYVDLMERKTDPEKYWKHNKNDWKERENWEDYMNAYDDIFQQCNTSNSWVIVPSGKSWYKKYIVAKTILDAMEAMDLQFPDIKID